MKCGIPRRMRCSRPDSKHRQRRVKICKTFALALTSAAPQLMLNAYGSTITPAFRYPRSGSYLSLSSGGSWRNDLLAFPGRGAATELKMNTSKKWQVFLRSCEEAARD
jgi:hypothetical protein